MYVSRQPGIKVAVSWQHKELTTPNFQQRCAGLSKYEIRKNSPKILPTCATFSLGRSHMYIIYGDISIKHVMIHSDEVLNALVQQLIATY